MPMVSKEALEMCFVSTQDSARLNKILDLELMMSVKNDCLLFQQR